MIISNDRTRELTPAVVAGSPEAVEEVIMGMKQLALSIAKRYSENLWDSDISSVALLALVEGCKKARTTPIKHLKQFLKQEVEYQCLQFKIRDQVISIPSTSLRRQTQRFKRHSLKDVPVRSGPDLDDLAIRELLDLAAETDLEKMIVKFLGYGFTQEEIATKAGVSSATVSVHLSTIRMKYARLCHREGG